MSRKHPFSWAPRSEEVYISLHTRSKTHSHETKNISPNEPSNGLGNTTTHAAKTIIKFTILGLTHLEPRQLSLH